MSSDLAIDIQGLTKTYHGKKVPDKTALNSVSLQVKRGAFYGLLGPNGAGKSTLINILAGLVVKTGGSVKINGYDIDAQTRQARYSIGVVPQELVVDTFFTVRQALDIHAGYYGIPKAKRRTDEIIAALGLEDKADIHSRRLSGGMRRRLLIGKALVHQPELLILDEPTAGVDVELREQLWNYVRELNEAGTTILLTTHYLEEAEQLCDRIAIINHGDVIEESDKKSLMKRIDHKEVVVTYDGEPADMLAILKDYAPKIDGNILRLSYQPSEVAFGELLHLLQQSKAVILDMSIEEPELEDIFRELTRSAA